MITKESLIRDRDSANTALLKLKQKYKNNSCELYLIVEGKDDVAYYTCIFERYKGLAEYEIIVARNRNKVIATFNAIDWNIYSNNRILFFVDRDLSDITKDYTPTASNVYVTDDYSIENSLFTKRLLLNTLKVFYNLNDLAPEEIDKISDLYSEAVTQHEKIFMTVMSLILYWRMSRIDCNLDNINDEKFIDYCRGTIALKPEYNEEDDLIKYISDKCSVAYKYVDLSEYKELIETHGGIKKIIRGKYIRSFFIKFLISVVEEFSDLFPSRITPKSSVPIGSKNALSVLCGYMRTPESLEHFLARFMGSSIQIT